MLLDLTMNTLLRLKMFLLNYPLKQKISKFAGTGGEGLYRFTCYLDTLRDGKLTQQLVSNSRGEGSGGGTGGGRGRGFDLCVSVSHTGWSEQAPVL